MIFSQNAKQILYAMYRDIEYSLLHNDKITKPYSHVFSKDGIPDGSDEIDAMIVMGAALRNIPEEQFLGICSLWMETAGIARTYADIEKLSHLFGTCVMTAKTYNFLAKTSPQTAEEIYRDARAKVCKALFESFIEEWQTVFVVTHMKFPTSVPEA